jgi:hypothetical protein
VAGRDGRDPVAPKQADITFANPPGQPAENQEGDYATGAFGSGSLRAAKAAGQLSA